MAGVWSGGFGFWPELGLDGDFLFRGVLRWRILDALRDALACPDALMRCGGAGLFEFGSVR